jgi:VanZ family protein
MNWSYIKAFIWGVLIFIGSAIPGDSLNGVKFINISGFDKIVHFTWYFVLCLFILAGAKKQIEKLKIWQIVLIAMSCFFYGGLLEVLQGTVFNKRSQDIYDFIANCLGALIASFIFSWLIKRKFWRRVL